MIGRMAIVALLMAPVPAVAQAAASSPAAAPAPAAVDPQRLAAARPVVLKIWPLGTYQRLMSSTMDRMMDQIIATVFDMKASDFASATGAQTKRTKEALGDATMGEVAKNVDPHFSERTKIMTRVIFTEMTTLMAKAEPEVQNAIAHGLARRFTVAELDEIGGFFATPVGARYAADSLLLTAEPEMVAAMTKFVPEMMQALPGIMKKVEAATAHLPPLSKPKADEGAGTE